MELAIDLVGRQLTVYATPGARNNQNPYARLMQLGNIADQYRKQGVIEEGVFDFKDEQLPPEARNIREYFANGAGQLTLVMGEIVWYHAGKIEKCPPPRNCKPARYNWLFWHTLARINRYNCFMRECMERIIPLEGLRYPEKLARQVETEAESLHAQGWFFAGSMTDELMENLTLFFERDVEVQ